ncbi:hypothetical protein COCSADRAFT_152957 [Bipolaris sorokiniana ND90Pr]|uniref:Uncharacterized protein n=1 Tax=Cochliobolus sativus (strain ND90Pr / ATCC 201652) TaxID=665912 RepID=M2RW81_COCSN|nr:uncharacterized protein COCSADRAFT_152957 [Bipolaris sorokiniana ND90Pr]EMD59323.1 hypothetical protein COCSADRAFT_152957 [Bipolaris sorokiniana ND90Pr]
MQPYPPNGPLVADRNESSHHRGPLSRTWPQIFKKRRRYSPVRESAQQQQQQQQHIQPNNVQPQAQPQPTQQQIQPVQIPIHPIRPIPTPSIASQSVTSPTVSSMRSPSIAADTASTISSISHASSIPPPNKVPIARRGSSISSADRNGAGGVITPQADLLASKSNYELISSGQHLEMGLHFSTAMASGVMMKRATHRAAEQARRDRMKNAMVDLAEFLLDGEVTFGSGTTCFVVMRGKEEDCSNGNGGGGGSSIAEDKEDGDDKSRRSSVAAGEKKTVNKARLIEMALEKMRAQEREIEMLRAEVERLKVDQRQQEVEDDGVQSMDTS